MNWKQWLGIEQPWIDVSDTIQSYQPLSQYDQHQYWREKQIQTQKTTQPPWNVTGWPMAGKLPEEPQPYFFDMAEYAIHAALRRLEKYKRILQQRHFAKDLERMPGQGLGTSTGNTGPWTYTDAYSRIYTSGNSK